MKDTVCFNPQCEGCPDNRGFSAKNDCMPCGFMACKEMCSDCGRCGDLAKGFEQSENIEQ